MRDSLSRDRNFPFDDSLRGRSATTKRWIACLVVAVIALSSSRNLLMAEDKGTNSKSGAGSAAWQEEVVKRARIMSRLKWTPVADGMPMKGKGDFKKGVEYTGVPYSSAKYEGRYIGFDISLKTFLAAVQNPHSVVYTENLSGKVKNAACYYGKVCSSFTSYALGCGIWFRSTHHVPPHREGVVLVESQSAEGAKVGDVIYTFTKTGCHVELVTAITRDDDGSVTHVRVEESSPPTTKNTNRSTKKFNSHIRPKNRNLYRITDSDAWHGKNLAESLLLPNYEEDSTKPVINRVLLLDRGDWVPYQKGQVVRFNIMDKDKQGVKKLVIKRGEVVVEEIDKPRKGVTVRMLSDCGDYSAYCVMADGSNSQACEFSVCDLDCNFDAENVSAGKPMELKFTSDNMKVAMVFLSFTENPLQYHGCVFVTEEDRRKGKITIPGDIIRNEGHLQIWLIGENRYGRLKQRKDVLVRK